MTYKEKLEQLVISSLLGDGSFTKKGYSKYSKLSVAHCIQQKELIQYKHNILAKNKLANTLCYNKIVNERYKKGYIEEFRFKSKPYPLFLEIRNECYNNNGYKRILPKYINNINELGLALWYMDDGNVTNDSYQLNTQSFTNDEKLYLINLLKTKWNIDCTIHKQGQIYILKSSAKIFENTIKKYILPTMQYKLIPYNKRGSCINRVNCQER